MLLLPAQHFPADNALSRQPLRLTACGWAPFWCGKPKREEKSCFLGQGFRGAWPGVWDGEQLPNSWQRLVLGTLTLILSPWDVPAVGQVAQEPARLPLHLPGDKKLWRVPYRQRLPFGSETGEKTD